MILTLLASKHFQPDIRCITHLVNSLQTFFVVEECKIRVDLPRTTALAPTLTATTIESLGPVSKIVRGPLPEEHVVLLTSRRIMVEPHGGPQLLSIISDNGRIWDSSNQSVIWFASKILRLGLCKMFSKACKAPGCICSVSDRGMFLCTRCELKLKNLDYRDALNNFRAELQWMNERLGLAYPSLKRTPPQLMPARLPLADSYAERLRDLRAFKGKGILMVLHFLLDLIPFVEALHKMGAAFSDMLLIAKPYPYPRRDYISHYLRQLGVRVYRASQQDSVLSKAKNVLDELLQAESFRQKDLIVIEDGGYFTPLLHEPQYKSLLRRCRGAVEQTTKGIRVDEAIPKKRIPILSVAKCNFKSRYESPEIGRVTVQNIARFVPNLKLSGERAVVFGFGDIGAQVAYQLNKTHNMAVSVVDNDPTGIRIMEAIHSRDFVAEAASTFSKLEFKNHAILAVGTTGRTSITRDVLRALRPGCVIVSTSSDRIEVDFAALDEMAGSGREIEEGKTLYKLKIGKRRKPLTVLAKGYPINFYGSESVPNATIDPIMTLLLLSAVDLCTGKRKPNRIDEDRVNALVEFHGLIKEFLRRPTDLDL